MKVPEIPSFSQDDEWWNRVVLEAIIELENAFVKYKQMTSSLKAKSPMRKHPASRKGGNDMPCFKLIDDN